MKSHCNIVFNNLQL